MSEYNNRNAADIGQAEIKYPIILHQNVNANAKPPYKVLRFPNGDFIQLIDMRCKRFSDPQFPDASYAIALFKIREEETALIKIRPERLDYLAEMLYEYIPEDRFVRASVVKENKLYDIRVETLTRTIDAKSVPADNQPQPSILTPQMADAVFTQPDPKTERAPFAGQAPQMKEDSYAPAAHMPAKDIGRINLQIIPDMLDDFQRETYIFEPVRSARRITAEDISALSMTELMSVAFVTSKCNVSRMPQRNKDIRDANFNTLLNAIAERLKHNPFYVICDYTDYMPVCLFNNGIPFTPIFSSRAQAESVISENGCAECVEVNANKDEFFRMLMERGIVQFIVDGNPLTLAVKGHYHFMSKV